VCFAISERSSRLNFSIIHYIYIYYTQYYLPTTAPNNNFTAFHPLHNIILYYYMSVCFTVEEQKEKKIQKCRSCENLMHHPIGSMTTTILLKMYAYCLKYYIRAMYTCIYRRNQVGTIEELYLRKYSDSYEMYSSMSQKIGRERDVLQLDCMSNLANLFHVGYSPPSQIKNINRS